MAHFQRGSRGRGKNRWRSRGRGNRGNLRCRGPRCPLFNNCKNVRIGHCNGHRDCHFGVLCRELRKRECRFYHPPDHFKATDGLVADSNFSIQPDDVLDKLHCKPSRQYQRWTKVEDAVLLKFIKKYPDTYARQEQVAAVEKELKYERSAESIKTRIRSIAAKSNKHKTDKQSNADWSPFDTNTHSNTNQEDGNNDEESSDDESSESSDDAVHAPNDPIPSNDSNQAESTMSTDNVVHQTKSESTNSTPTTALKIRAITVFEKLSRYHLVDNNHFDYRNVQSSLSALKQCNGEEKEVMAITLNPLRFFEKKVAEFETKFGSIDFEMERNIIRQLQLTKTLLQRTVTNIDTVIVSVKGKMCLGRESEFKDITGYDLRYFQNIVRAINAPKCTANTGIRRAVRRRPEMSLKTEVTNINASAMSKDSVQSTVKTEQHNEALTNPPAPTQMLSSQSDAGCCGETTESEKAMKQEPPDNVSCDVQMQEHEGSATRLPAENGHSHNLHDTTNVNTASHSHAKNGRLGENNHPRDSGCNDDRNYEYHSHRRERYRYDDRRNRSRSRSRSRERRRKDRHDVSRRERSSQHRRSRSYYDDQWRP